MKLLRMIVTSLAVAASVTMVMGCNVQTRSGDDCAFRSGKYALTFTLKDSAPKNCGKGGTATLTMSGKSFEEDVHLFSSCPTAPTTRTDDECGVSFSGTACKVSTNTLMDHQANYTWTKDASSATGTLTTTSRPETGTAAPITCEYSLTIAR